MIRPGQVVVCVTLTASCACGSSHAASPGSPQPVVGRHYRVATVLLGMCNHCRTVLPALVPTGPDGAALDAIGKCWPCCIFRPLEPATVDILRMADAPLEPAL